MGLFSSIYCAGLSGRKFFYKTGIKKTRKLPVKVISIGNLTLGGTGKTPAVIAVAGEAKKTGFRPCVLTRGYKGKVKGPCLAGGDKRALLTASQLGDEAYLIASRLKGVPVVKGNNRFLAGVHAMGELGVNAINMFILDDGFQHRALHRDHDILLIDASNPFGNGRLFPEGILREPVNEIARADTVIITKTNLACGETIKSVKNDVRRFCPEARIFTSFHRPLSLIGLSGNDKDIDSLKGREVYAFSGLAKNSDFVSMLDSHGARIKKFKSFRDHYHYRQQNMDEIKREAEELDIITTEKDMVKLKSFNLPKNLFALRIEFSINREFFNHIFGG